MGEIRSTIHLMALSCVILLPLFGCSSGGGGGDGGGGGSNNNTDTNPITDPDDQVALPNFVINVNGGTVDPGIGGSGGGGFVNIMKQGGSGPVEILNTGTVDASFEISSYTPDFGPVPLTIDNDTTLVVDPAVPPAAGTIYTYTSSDSIYIADGDNIFTNDPVATGLQIAPGATLTLPPNSTGTFLASKITCRFSHDIQNAGTLKTINGQAIEIVLQANNYVGETGSQLDMRSTSAGVDSSYITFSLNSMFMNKGEFNSSGYSDAIGAGTNAGEVTVYATGNIENTADIHAIGGDGMLGQGGNAGVVTLQSESGSVYNSGSITANGGNGFPGGQGGNVSLLASAYAPLSVISGFGEIRNSGDIDVSGGNALDSAGQLASNIGGHGGGIEFIVAGGDLRNNANLIANGGNTEETVADETRGGFGGNINLRAYHGLNLNGASEVLAGDVLITGNLNATGGSAINDSIGNATGGGSIAVALDLTGEQLPFDYRPTSSASVNQRLALLGYVNLSANASDGKLATWGGMIQIDNYAPLWDNTTMTWIDGGGGSIINEANLSARGGNLTAEFIDPVGSHIENGGYGGTISFRADIDTTLINPDGEQIINRGNIDLSGGDILVTTTAEAYAGGAGVLEHMGSDSIIFEGNMIANGGSGGLGGGQGGEVYFTSVAGSVDVQGTFSMDGGSASEYGANGGLFQVETMNSPGQAMLVDVDHSANGGDGGLQGGGGGGFILLDDDEIIASGEVNLSGGNADLTVTDSVGGGGGIAHFGAPMVDSSNMIVNATGGAGQIPGTP